MKIANLIRWSLTIILLVGVWFNSHWTVALSITLISLSIELITESVIRITKK